MATAHDEEKILNDVEESEELFFDIYIRFNGDSEKDYCFQVKLTTTFRDLYKIFDTLPIALRPLIFYDAAPIGFKVSTAPGYLTEDGNFLFDEQADQITKNVPQDEAISKHCWPGQLVLPVWQFNLFSFYMFVTALLVWLYTDLPDFISPTPGICLTNQVGRAIVWLATELDFPSIALSFAEDLSEPTSVYGGLLFFGFHVFKCLAIFFILYFGAFNPIKVWRFGPKSVKLNVTRDELIELGWTGSRKADIHEYRDYYREYKIQEHGGMVGAHKAGVFSQLTNLGCKLGMGEGYKTPIDHKLTLKDDLEGDKLVLNYEYFTQLGITFTMFIQDKDGKDLTDCIKQYRRYGLVHSNLKIKEIVAHRKLLAPAPDNQLVLDTERMEREASAMRWAQGDLKSDPVLGGTDPDTQVKEVVEDESVEITE